MIAGQTASEIVKYDIPMGVSISYAGMMAALAVSAQGSHKLIIHW